MKFFAALRCSFPHLGKPGQRGTRSLGAPLLLLPEDNELERGRQFEVGGIDDAIPIGVS